MHSWRAILSVPVPVEARTISCHVSDECLAWVHTEETFRSVSCFPTSFGPAFSVQKVTVEATNIFVRHHGWRMVDHVASAPRFTVRFPAATFATHVYA